jgi:hypothetical protein
MCCAALYLTFFCYAAAWDWWMASGTFCWKASQWQNDNIARCVPTYMDAQFNKACAFRQFTWRPMYILAPVIGIFLKIHTWDTTHAHCELYKFACTQYIIKDTVCKDQFFYLYLGCHLGIVLKICIWDTFTFSLQMM